MRILGERVRLSHASIITSGFFCIPALLVAFFSGVSGAVAQVGTPALSSPSNGASGLPTTVTLSWGSVSLATSYEMQLASDNSFATIIVDQTLGSTSYTVSGLTQGATYYWRVRAATVVFTGSWSSTWSFGTASSTSPPTVPVLASPANGQSGQGTTETFTWSASAGATSYSLQVATDNSFVSPLYNGTGIAGTSQQVTGLAAGTTYFWRAEAVNAGGASGWSSSWSFSTAPSQSPPSAPTLSSPANGASNQFTSISLSWSSVSTADHYWLQVATDNSFANIVYGDSTLTSTSQLVNYLSASTTYYWRVRGINSAGAGSWSGVWSFSTASSSVQPPAAPSQISPANSASSQPTTITFTWSASANTDDYFLQVATDQSFSKMVYTNYTIVATSQQVSSLSPSTTYYWHVKASNTGGESAWSATWSFTTAAPVPPPSLPVLASPDNGASSLPDTVLLSWYRSAAASNYRLQVSIAANFSSLLVDDSTLTDTSQIISGLTSGTTYYWRVETSNTSGVSGWTTAWSFKTSPSLTIPPVPVLLAPPNGSTNEPAEDTLVWNSSSGASAYRIEISTGADFSSTVVNDSAVSATSLVTPALAAGAEYFWRVEAYNAAGMSGWSNIWSFETAAQVVPPGTPTLVSPTNGSQNQPFTDSLKWSPVQYATSYQVRFSTYPSLDSTMIKDSTTTADYEVVGVLRPSTTYYWSIRAVNTAGASAWSSKWSFTTAPVNELPGAPVLLSPANGGSGIPIPDTLSWSATTNAQSYEIQISSSDTFGHSVVVDSTLVSTRIAPARISFATTYWWRVKAENSIGGSSWSNVWSFTTVSRDTDKPVLIAPSDGEEGLPATVVCSWRGVSNVSEYRLQAAYDPGFDSIAVDDSTVASDYLTLGPLTSGEVFYWRVSAKYSSGYWGPFTNPWRFVIGTQSGSSNQVIVATVIDFPSQSDSSSLKSTDYRLVGLPGNSNLPVTVFMTGASGTDWEAYWDNGDASNYMIKYDPSKSDTMFKFGLGKAFWLIKKGPLILDTTVSAAPLDSSGATHIPLHAGWNLITDPFADSVSWTSVQAVNNTAELLYDFRGAFQTSGELYPGHGFYFFNSDSLPSLSVSAPAGKSSAAQKFGQSPDKVDDASWRIGVTLTSGGVTDDALWFGVSPIVTGNFNSLDLRKPATFASSPETFFMHSDWDKKYPYFASEVHPAESGISEWNFEVISYPFKDAALSFSGIDHVPAQLDVYAIDPVSGSWHDLRKSPEIDFVPESSISSVKIVVGADSIVKKELRSGSALSMELGSNYPNPFNPSTTIPIYLSASTKVNVTVFNVLGETIARLYEGELQEGTHLFTWNGTDLRGDVVPSGVYFCSAVSSTGIHLIHKMMLMK